ncbi:MAG: Gfo/Idh/MocA family oxidoreductase [Candidatus Hydrogenedentes bacterium]|nr:Gfo/Idh/MocA family oxidoreductase [Candidatus Hydrogenedentota bacterium]
MKRDSSRRQFLQQSAAAGAAGMFGGCAIAGREQLAAAAVEAPAPVPVRERRVLGANDRIQVGFIGIGKRGGAILDSTLKRDDVDVVAIADICDMNRAAALAKCRTKVADAREYVQFEELFEKERLDAIVTASPDHIHTPVILTALEARCDVYSEKPMTLTMDEAKAIRDKARATGAVFQVGTQLRSNNMYQAARAAVQSGAIGTLMAVHVNRNMWGAGVYDIPPGLTAESTHWDLFLRETKPYPFDADRFINWRKYVEYSNGAAGDLMLHHLDLCHFITGCGMPERVMSVGGQYAKTETNRTTPDTISVLLEYPEGFQFNYITAYVNGHYGLTERYLGTDGTIEVRDMGTMSIFRGRMEDEQEEIVVSEGILDGPHLENFFAAMRTRGEPIAPIEAGFMGATCAHMAVLSEQSGESAKWDAATETIAL